MAYVVVFVAAAIPWLEVLLVVPAGIVAGLPAAPTAVVAAAGNLATLVPLVLMGDRLRDRWLTRRGAGSPEGHVGPSVGVRESPDELRAGDVACGSADGVGARDVESTASRGRRAHRVLVRYGLPGLAVLGPLATGVHVAALVALASGAPRRATLSWLTGGVLAWAALAAFATVAGIDLLVDPDQLPPLPWLGP